MSTEQVQIERRGAQRFDFHLPVSVRLPGGDREGNGFTQDLSARGALFYTDFALAEGDPIELTLVMPSEITLAENMRVRCRGKVVRVAKPVVGTRTGIAVHLEGYEFLPDADPAASFGRISALHEHKEEEPSAAEPLTPPRATMVP
jgi:hypothetical protein